MCGDARVSGDGADGDGDGEQSARGKSRRWREEAGRTGTCCTHVRGERLLDPLRAHAALARALQHRRPLRPTTKYMYIA